MHDRVHRIVDCRVPEREVGDVDAVVDAVAWGCERCMMRRHFPERFLGTAPRGLTMKLGRGGVEKGPAVCPAAPSFWR